MFKIVIVFLLVMLVISMAASAITRFLQGDAPRAARPLDKSQIRARCGHCGRPVVGTTPCACGKG